MVDYGLNDRVALITGANNPQGIGATTAFAFAREGAKVVLVYKRIPRPFDKTKTDRNGADRYFQANAGNADVLGGQSQGCTAGHPHLRCHLHLRARYPRGLWSLQTLRPACA